MPAVDAIGALGCCPPSSRLLFEQKIVAAEPIEVLFEQPDAVRDEFTGLGRSKVKSDEALSVVVRSTTPM